MTMSFFAVFMLAVAPLLPQGTDAGLETKLWQERIDACAARGGGKVCVTPGVHVVGQLYLRSNVELHLEKGARLEGAAGLHNYVVHRLPFSEGDWCAVLMGLNVTNVAITGQGEIFGNGASFENVLTRGVCWEGFRPRGIFFSQSKGIRLEGFTLRDTACWGIVFKCCEDVVARRIRIDSNVNHNNDGFDVEARNVLIEDCEVDSSDDCYCVKSNNPDFTVENVVVRNCVARPHCNAYKIGTATHGTIRRVRFERCRTEPPRRIYRDWVKVPEDPTAFVKIEGIPSYLCGPGISAVCIECVDGGVVEDIVACDITTYGCQVPVFVRGGARTYRICGIPPSDRFVFRNIVVSNVCGRAESKIASSVSGCAKCVPENVVLANLDIVCRGDGLPDGPVQEPGPEFDRAYPESTMFKSLRLPAYGLYVGRARNVRMDNVRFSLLEGTSDARPPVFVSRQAKPATWATAEELEAVGNRVCAMDFHSGTPESDAARFYSNTGKTAFVEFNYDESKAGEFGRDYTLEDPLAFADGRKVASAADWAARRRELLGIFEREVYGKLPPRPDEMAFDIVSEKMSEDRFALLRTYRQYFRADKTGPVVDWLVVLPRHAQGKVPVFLHLNYAGLEKVAAKKTNHYDLPWDMLVANGYAFMSAKYTQITGDGADRGGFFNGVCELWGMREAEAADKPGSLMIWAWGLMRGLDLAEKIAEIDASRNVVIGSSRLGKAALLAAAYDERFKVCVPNQTGAVGVQLMKRDYGETLKGQHLAMAHWYCPAVWKYEDDPRGQPFDQHLLLACVAPRALLLECYHKKWFDPKGEWLAAKAASPVWEFLTGKGLGADEWPEPYSDALVRPPFGYARRTECHGLSPYDWKWAIDFANKALK